MINLYSNSRLSIKVLSKFLLKSLIILLFFNFVGVNHFCVADPVRLPSYVAKIDAYDKHQEYKIGIKALKPPLRANVESTLELSFCYGASYGRGKSEGDSVKNLQTIYGRIAEVFLVSDDLTYFAHLRPEDYQEITPEVKASSKFIIKETFPFGGFYRMVVCFSHRGQIIYKHFNLTVEGHSNSESHDNSASRLNPQSAEFDGYNVTVKLEPSPPVPNRKTSIVYNIQDENGENVTDLDVFMGTELHFVSWRDDLAGFGYERTKPDKGKPGTVMVVPPVQTEMKYGTGILREILKDGKMLIEHGKVKSILPAGQYTFKVNDPEASIKVETGDWVEFWINNTPEDGIVITRIEPLATVPSGDEEGVYSWAGNIPIYPGPLVPIEHKFKLPGKYVLFGQFFHKEKVVTTRFVVDVKNTGTFIAGAGSVVEESDEDKGIIKLSKQELNGQLIYRKSKSSSGKSIFIKQDDGSKIDAITTGITCVGCHAEDGRGGQEGGVLSSDIRYEFLSKPYGVTHPSGRKHPAYDDGLVERAIVDGVDPGKNKLDPTMVRWEMSDSDLKDLVAYIHRLSEMGKPGVTNSFIRVGCVLDMSGPLSNTGLSTKEMIEAAFDNINKNGSIYGRSLKLVVADGGNNMAKSLEAAKWLVEKGNVFCFIANLGEAAMQEVVPFLEEKGIPLVAPLAPTFEPGSFVEQSSFYLFPTIGYQERVLVDFILRTRRDKTSKPKIAAIYSNDRYGKNGLNAVKEQLAQYGTKLAGEVVYDYKDLNYEKMASLLAETEADNVLVITPDSRVISVVAEADRLGFLPRYLCNNMLVMKDILNIPKASERFLIVQNFSFAGHDNPNCSEFLKIVKRIPVRSRNMMLQMAAFVGVKLLEEGLRLTGRDLTRESFIVGMEEVELNTGLFGVVSYRAGKHNGVSGVYLVKPDPAIGNFVPASKWLKPVQGGTLF